MDQTRGRPIWLSLPAARSEGQQLVVLGALSVSARGPRKKRIPTHESSSPARGGSSAFHSSTTAKRFRDAEVAGRDRIVEGPQRLRVIAAEAGAHREARPILLEQTRARRRGGGHRAWREVVAGFLEIHQGPRGSRSRRTGRAELGDLLDPRLHEPQAGAGLARDGRGARSEHRGDGSSEGDVVAARRKRDRDRTGSTPDIEHRGGCRSATSRPAAPARASPGRGHASSRSDGRTTRHDRRRSASRNGRGSPRRRPPLRGRSRRQPSIQPAPSPAISDRRTGAGPPAARSCSNVPSENHGGGTASQVPFEKGSVTQSCPLVPHHLGVRQMRAHRGPRPLRRRRDPPDPAPRSP
jgi:hypothetical protein